MAVDADLTPRPINHVSKDLPRLHKPWVVTPCISSAPLSRAAGCQIFLKLENLQPSGSFKSRGIGNLLLRAIESHGPAKPIRFYCSSGGNAGLACVTAAITLQQPATIVVPLSTSAFMVGKLKTLGADVHQVGADWASADRWMREELLAKDFNGVYVPPFDHPDIWEGAATIVPELAEQIGSFDGVVCSIGGGGLFNGIMEGLERGPNKTGPRIKVLAMETIGAHSLAASVDAGEHITLPKITSIATSLGAVRVSEKTWQWAQSPAVTCLALEDKDAASACVRFADDERIIVEVACGISIAPCYNGELRRAFGAGLDDMEWARQKVVIIVCGGSNVTLQVLERYRETYGI